LGEVDNVVKMLKTSFNDPITNILLKHSNLTTSQYETFIIDTITVNLSDKELTYEDKKLLRHKKVSRGSFSRTLSQARRNIISAIYTVILLNYTGIFEGAPFDDYQILSEKLRTFVTDIDLSDPAQSKQLKIIERELTDGIEKLAEPKGLKIL
jgi:hypothetical protein